MGTEDETGILKVECVGATSLLLETLCAFGIAGMKVPPCQLSRIIARMRVAKTRKFGVQSLNYLSFEQIFNIAIATGVYIPQVELIL